MPFVHTLPHIRPQASARLLAMPREPAAESGAACRRLCRRLCQRTDCPADFSANGGVATATDVSERLRVKVSQPVSVLAHWIIDRQVLAFSCGAGLLLPLFQFDFAQGCVRSGVVPAMSELTGLMSDLEVARWFARPNGCLSGAVPAQALLTDVSAVLAAARAERLVAIS